jgi:RimJ/RimL family protein N-acetyltransferase
MHPFLGNELLRGDLVYLARPTPDDISVIAGWSADVEYSRNLRRGLIYPDVGEGYTEWFTSLEKERSGYPFAVRRSDDRSLIGFVVLHDLYWQARHCTFVIGLDPALRGRGYGTDTLRVMLKFAFLEMNLNRVGLDVMSYNEAAIHTYAKVGFQHEGRVRAVVYRDGVYYDIIHMGILRSEWETLYNQPAISYPAGDAAPE